MSGPLSALSKRIVFRYAATATSFSISMLRNSGRSTPLNPGAFKTD
jgi:hypothetical protein